MHTGEVDNVVNETRCRHAPRCPAADNPAREAARTVVTHPEQGWSLLCNGIVLFEDTGELLPNGDVIAPHRPTDAHPEARAPRLLGHSH
ncbi:MAG: DUF5999 family protein [Nocardioidaceae bacterium]